MRYTGLLLLVTLIAAGCATQPVADHCTVALSPGLERAISDTTARLGSGCEYHFDSYFQQLLAIAEDNPDKEAKRQFSQFLVDANQMGVISTRQAKELYNRYFNVKYVSFTGDYNTCAQTCPVRKQVMSDMKNELRDKERGLLLVSEDRAGYYRANSLLKETELVLEATCRACASGAGQ